MNDYEPIEKWFLMHGKRLAEAVLCVRRIDEAVRFYNLLSRPLDHLYMAKETKKDWSEAASYLRRAIDSDIERLKRIVEHS